MDSLVRIAGQRRTHLEGPGHEAGEQQDVEVGGVVGHVHHGLAGWREEVGAQQTRSAPGQQQRQLGPPVHNPVVQAPPLDSDCGGLCWL